LKITSLRNKKIGVKILFPKYIKVWSLIALTMICVGCSTPAQGNTNQTSKVENYTLQYVGQSKDWHAVLVVKSLDGREGDIINLVYTGSDKKSAGKIKGTFILPEGGTLTGDGVAPDPNGIYEFQGRGTAMVPPNKDAIAKATIEWNGQKETFDMKPN
jgi:hypothetical protein